MAQYQYYVGGKLFEIHATNLSTGGRRSRSSTARPGTSPASEPSLSIINTLRAQQERLLDLFNHLSESHLVSMKISASGSMIIPTESIVLDGAKQSEIRWLRDKYGLTEVKDGRAGKSLLRVPEEEEAGIQMAFDVSQDAFERGNVGAAHPNFLRIVQRPSPSQSAADDQWNLYNSGETGLIGADVHARAAWTITKGTPDIRVAVLDEGVDTLHPHLQHAVVAEADFVDGHDHARPDGNDAHGTACAGVIVSKDDHICGLAPQVSLVAARIAKSSTDNVWIFDDFDTADAIDWAWNEAAADVLSNSWGGGPEADVITRALDRARTQGRNGKGVVMKPGFPRKS